MVLVLAMVQHVLADFETRYTEGTLLEVKELSLATGCILNSTFLSLTIEKQETRQNQITL